MTQYRSLPQFFLLLFTFLLSACSSVSHLTREDEAITSSLQPVKERYAPDRRIRVFDIRWERQGSRFVVKGEVDDAAAREDAVSAIRTTIGRDVIDSVRVLPDETVGQRRFGIVTVSVANMRSRPAQPAELATQVLMGMVVKLLKYEGGWYYVQSHDQYLAWLEPDAMVVIDRAGVEAWEQTQKVIVTEPYGLVRQKPDRNAFPVSDLVAGALLKKKGTDGGWVKVALPDGTEGFVEQAIVEDESTWRVTRVASPETIERTAMQFLGVPYLWGGTSVKGMDCSGFTKTVFRLNGMELNRDANQQALMGEEVVVDEQFNNLRTGDLLFFGRKATADRPERITHVAIYVGNKEYVHAPGGARVRINSFDPAAPNFSQSLLTSFVRARRVLIDQRKPR